MISMIPAPFVSNLKITEGVKKSVIPVIKYDDATLFEYENSKANCDPYYIQDRVIYPSEATIEEYLFWTYDLEITQEDIEETTFEEITQ